MSSPSSEVGCTLSSGSAHFRQSLKLGAPKWPPRPPNARSAPAEPWRASTPAPAEPSGSVERAGVAVPAHAVAVDREAGVDERPERGGLADRSAVPQGDLETADRTES